MPSTPTVSHGDAYSVGQLAKRLGKSHDFVRRMISEDKIAVDERGLITNLALHEFMHNHATELD
ncbi:hypothetical protein [Nocardioides deserti]|uniref:Helix-turn-helix domain-containing protein n=1 Tax=Nocardioides deserti TaxID=1588644 RepID=A0ABR6UA73_9ACTN|nr:hypothetical protein [Nocardioides deserti]MBC2961332.1 hypothetical protein [Nocardioides deserti]GGO72435.1 hypothetical protein GCM10012276_15790 [Nocardioides deserti]